MSVELKRLPAAVRRPLIQPFQVDCLISPWSPVANADFPLAKQTTTALRAGDLWSYLRGRRSRRDDILVAWAVSGSHIFGALDESRRGCPSTFLDLRHLSNVLDGSATL